jgi:hypothetical protein
LVRLLPKPCLIHLFTILLHSYALSKFYLQKRGHCIISVLVQDGVQVFHPPQDAWVLTVSPPVASSSLFATTSSKQVRNRILLHLILFNPVWVGSVTFKLVHGDKIFPIEHWRHFLQLQQLLVNVDLGQGLVIRVFPKLPACFISGIAPGILALARNNLAVARLRRFHFVPRTNPKFIEQDHRIKTDFQCYGVLQAFLTTHN